MPGTTSIRRKAIVVVGAVAVALTAAGSASASESYVISPGDTLYSIAQRHGITVETISQMNGIQNPNLIYAGQRLSLGATDGSASQQAAPSSSSYTIQPGDTLWSIASRHGITVAQLVEANRSSVSDQHLIYAGHTIVIPGQGGAAGGSPPAQPAEQSDPAPQPDQATSSADVAMILRETALAYGLDPALVQAIAWQESGWQQHVVSSSGALGVMQVMPSTGGWISSDLVGRPLNIQGSVAENVLAGVVYLEWLIRYTGSENQALAAYYQGPASVSRDGWYGETHTYVANVNSIRSHIQQHGAPPR